MLRTKISQKSLQHMRSPLNTMVQCIKSRNIYIFFSLCYYERQKKAKEYYYNKKNILYHRCLALSQDK